tara:strand:+ start:8353 stop:9291 length:939 start_codon:yes stop_codon:yes gene_type:complete
MSEESTILHHKYAPTTIEEVILPKELKNKFTKIVAKNDIPHMILYSVEPGSGKSTIAKLLAKLCDVESLYINNSLARGIEVLRGQIQRFAEAMGFDGKTKVVILDEMDGSTADMQKGLKGFLDEFGDDCRFICTCNNVAEIIKPLHSRMDMVDFNFEPQHILNEIGPQIGKRLVKILKSENIDFDINDVKRLIFEHYPDMRSMIKIIRDSNERFGCLHQEMFRIAKAERELFDLILKRKITQVREYAIQNRLNYLEIYGIMKKKLLDNKMIVDGSIRAEILVILAKYQDMATRAPDKELTFAACLVEMFREM